MPYKYGFTSESFSDIKSTCDMSEDKRQKGWSWRRWAETERRQNMKTVLQIFNMRRLLALSEQRTKTMILSSVVVGYHKHSFHSPWACFWFLHRNEPAAEQFDSLTNYFPSADIWDPCWETCFHYVEMAEGNICVCVCVCVWNVFLHASRHHQSSSSLSGKSTELQVKLCYSVSLHSQAAAALQTKHLANLVTARMENQQVLMFTIFHNSDQIRNLIYWQCFQYSIKLLLWGKMSSCCNVCEGQRTPSEFNIKENKSNPDEKRSQW